MERTQRGVKGGSTRVGEYRSKYYYINVEVGSEEKTRRLFIYVDN